jgi:hypothetical protein
VKAGDLIFVAETGFIPDLIRDFDHGPFDHVAIVVSDTQIIEAQYGHKVGLKDFHYDEDEYAIISLDLTDEEIARVPEFDKKYEGEDYNFEEIISIVIRLLFGLEHFDLLDDKDEVICSQLAAYFAQNFGKAEKGTELLAPNQLFNYFINKGYKPTWYNK